MPSFRNAAGAALVTLGLGLSGGAPGAAEAEAPPPATIPESALAAAKRLQDKALGGGSVAMPLVRSLVTTAGPRLVGSEGERRAVAWAVENLRKLGLQDVRTETFTIAKGWEREGERGEIVAPGGRNPLVLHALGGSAGTPDGGIEAEVVHFPTLRDLEAAPAERVRGKIVYIGERMIRAQDGAGYGPVVAGRSRGPAEASKRGAAGFILRSVGTSTARVAHTGVTTFPEGVAPIPAAAISNADADLLELKLAGGEPVRVKLELGAKFTGPVDSVNVVADIKGSEAPDEYVVLGAHLDSWDNSPAAQDDAAGIAIVMAAAKLILEEKERPRRSIRIILFGAEEWGLLGARAYVAAHREKIDRYVIGTEADAGDGPVYRFATRVDPAALPALELVHRALRPLGVVPGDNAASGGPDMTPFRQAGMPVIDLDHDVTDYFDIHHTPDDTLAKVDPAHLDQAVAAYATFAYLAARSTGTFRPLPPSPPQLYSPRPTPPIPVPPATTTAPVR